MGQFKLTSGADVPVNTTSGALDVGTARQWICAFADQTTEHAILLLDLHLSILWANTCAGKILGLPSPDLVGRSVRSFFTPDDRALGIPEYEAMVSTSFGASDDDRWMQRADGSRFWATGKTVTLVDGEGCKAGLVKVFRNQTDTKMHLQTLQNRIVALTEAEAVRNAAVATLSHELRNPLSAINLAVALVDRLTHDGQLAPQLRMIETNVALISRLLEDVDRARSTPDADIPLQIEPLPIHEVHDYPLATALERAGHPERSIDVILPPGQPIEFEGDRARIHQVAVNLIGNALKFTADGGHIWIKGNTEGSQALIRVEDDGLGITPGMLDAIFGMFTRAEVAADYEGRGIGLALVRNIVQAHGGTVQARSDGPGHGAEFTIRLPLVQTGRER